MVLDYFGKRGFTPLEVPVKTTQEFFSSLKNSFRFQKEPLVRLRTGFTLVELFIVIGILAVLATATVVVLNPAELLAQSRDASRASDIRALKIGLQAYFIEHSGSSMGTSGIAYISIPDINANCSGLSLPAGSYRCATSANYRKADSTGWLPLNLTNITTALNILPVDPVNSGNSYYVYSTDGQGFTLSSHPESEKYASDPKAFTASGGSSKLIGGNFPEGWIYVPGNETFNTDGFWAMKYEAKCVSGTTPLTYTNATYNVYNNLSQPCTGSYYIASTADGYPIALIDHSTAKSYCEAIGAHLLTNDEWMTISYNAAAVKSNWSGGSPGSGYLFSGNNDGNPGKALEASLDDTDGYLGTGNVSPSNQRRTLTLSNGSVIWDLAGNITEHVARSVNNAGDNTAVFTALPVCSDGVADWGYCDFVTTIPYITNWSADVTKKMIAPPNDNWYSSHGMGKVYSYKNGGISGTPRVLLRGGWSTGAGAFHAHLDWNASTAAYYSIGFRCSR